MIVRRTVFIARITLILWGAVAATACSTDPDASAPDAAGGTVEGGSEVGGNAGNGGAGAREAGLSEGSADAGGNADADGNAGAGGSAGTESGAVEGGVIEGGALDAEASTPIPDHCGGLGASQIGCPCATEGQYSCYRVGDGLECMGGVWIHFIDGPCFPTADAGSCTDQVVGCKCPLLRQRICVNGQGLLCFFADARWRSDPTACGDSSTAPD